MRDVVDHPDDLMARTGTEQLKDGCTRLNRCWNEFKWLIIIGTAVLAFVLGYSDMPVDQPGPPDEAGNPTRIERSFLDRVYLTSQLYVMEFSVPGEQLGWRLELARFLAPLTSIATAVTAIAQLFRGQIQLLWFQLGLFLPSRRYRHVVLCGAGWLGRALARGLLRQGRTVVLIELDADNHFIHEARGHGMIAISGNAAAAEVLLRAKVALADRLICVTGSDGTNSEVAFTAAGMVATDRPTPLICHVHVDDPRTMELLREREVNAEPRDAFRWQFFSVYERRADSLLRREPQSPLYHEKVAKWMAGAWPRPRHLVMVGAGRFGLALIARAARLWMEQRNGSQHRLRFSLVDPGASAAIANLSARYPRLLDYCNLKPFDLEPACAEFLRGDFLRNPEGVCEADMIYVCLDNDALTLQVSLELLRAVRDRMIPVTACVYCDKGLTHVMKGAERQLSGMTHLTHFHLMQKEAEPEDILWGTREFLARALHDFYVKYEHTHAPAGTDIGFACDWEDLPPEIRESNRRHVDSLSQWLLDEGYALDPCFDWHARPWTWSDAEAESLARQAHEWWRSERISSGWVHGPLKNVQERINPALVPWESLTEAGKERAMDFVRSYPRILANADLCIQPLLRTFEERVARAIHANYVERERARGMTPERNSSMVPWEQLPEELRASNIRQARSHFEKLQRINCGVELLAGRMPEDLVFEAREIERLAILEHESWRRERESAGWRWGPRKDTHTRTHPCLVDWEQLPGIEKQKDRDAVMDIPRLLASAGYQVCRRSPRV